MRNSCGKVDRANSQQWTESDWKTDEGDEDEVDVDSDVNCVVVSVLTVHGISEPFLSDVTRPVVEAVRSVGDTVVEAATTTATTMTSPVSGTNICLLYTSDAADE